MQFCSDLVSWNRKVKDSPKNGSVKKMKTYSNNHACVHVKRTFIKARIKTLRQFYSSGRLFVHIFYGSVFLYYSITGRLCNDDPIPV